jgi:hypothetical protein
MGQGTTARRTGTADSDRMVDSNSWRADYPGSGPFSIVPISHIMSGLINPVKRRMQSPDLPVPAATVKHP